MIAVTGTKGSPGTSTLAFGLASILARRSPSLLVEADPDGGVLAARLGIPQEPGLGTLAAAGRHTLSVDAIEGHVQPGPFTLRLVVSPSSPSHSRAALRAVAEGLGQALARSDGLKSVVDIGRLDSESPALELATHADELLILASPTLDGADAVAVRLADLDAFRRKVRLVTIGDGPYRGEELAQVLSVRHLGHLPHDHAGSTSLWSHPERVLKSRRPIGRALLAVAKGLDLEAGQPPPPRLRRLWKRNEEPEPLMTTNRAAG